MLGSHPLGACVPPWASPPFPSASGRGLKRDSSLKKLPFGSEVPETQGNST